MDASQPLIERIREAAATRTPLRIRGGGTKDFFGGPLQGEVLDTRIHCGVIAYEPSELFITARAGTPLAEIENLLAQHNQQLPFEPPHFGEGATLGGCVAAGLCGPARASAGALRDFVLGVTLVDGRAQTLRFGGQVMKNVAGFDVSRMMCGAMGTLGLMLDITLKVLPRPQAEATLAFACSAASAVLQFNQWAGQPLPISATSAVGGLAHVRLSGAPAAIESACKTMGGERLDPQSAAAHWQSLREQTHLFFTGDSPLWRQSLPSTEPLASDAMLIEWGGALRWHRGLDAPPRATCFRGEESRASRPLPKPLHALTERLKSSFDPEAILNPGRLPVHPA